MGEKRNAYRIIVGKPEGKRPQRRRWTILKEILRVIGWDGMDWIDLAEDRDQWKALMNTIMNLRVPQNGGKFLSGSTIDNFSRRAQLRKSAHLHAEIPEKKGGEGTERGRG
jgi:hypothetical protein